MSYVQILPGVDQEIEIKNNVFLGTPKIDHISVSTDKIQINNCLFISRSKQDAVLLINEAPPKWWHFVRRHEYNKKFKAAVKELRKYG